MRLRPSSEIQEEVDALIAIIRAKQYLRWYLTEFYGYPETVKLTHLETRQQHGEPRYIFKVGDGCQAAVYEWLENDQKCYRVFWHHEETTK